MDAVEPVKTVSNREFARMVGQSEGAVRKAISRGSIKEGVVDGKIIPDVAAREWGKVFVTETDDNAADLESVEPVIQETTLEIETSQQDIDELLNQPPVVIEPLARDEAQFLAEIPANTTKAEADRLLSVFKARKARLDALKTAGDLVDKGLVYQTLFEFSMQVRDNILNVPARIIDALLAAESRNEAIILLDAELSSALEQLSSLGDVRFIEK